MRNKKLIFSTLLFSFVTSFAFADEASSPTKFVLPPLTTTTAAAAPNAMARPSFLIPKFEFEHLSFLSANKTSFDSDQYASELTATGLSLKSTHRFIRVEGRWFYSQQEEAHYFDIPELSFESKRGDMTTHVGRHQHEWSAADRFWGTGRWQPRFLWDHYAAHDLGLTGVFVDKNLGENNRVMFFATVVNFVDQTPHYEEKNNEVTSKNPWFHGPPKAVKLWDQRTPIVSAVHEPEIEEVLLRPSVAVQWSHNWAQSSSEKSQMRAAYAYKPLNQPRYAFPYKLNLNAADVGDPSRLSVEVHVDYLYAHLATLENTWSVGGWSFTPSVTYEKPEQKRYPLTWISQTFDGTTIFSFTFENRPGPFQRGRRFYGGVTHLVGEITDDRGDNISDETLFNLRDLYFTAFRLGAEQIVARVNRRDVRGSLEATYDSVQQGGVVTSKMNLQVDRGFTVGAHVSFIGLLTDDNKPYDGGYYNLNRTNDVVGLELSYVF